MSLKPQPTNRPEGKIALYPDSKRSDSFERGLEFQDFAAEQLRDKLSLIVTFYTSKKYQYGTGESMQGFEFKLDQPCSRTGRLSIETDEKTKASNSEWAPSGIYRTDNTWMYVQGNEDILFLFPKNILQMLHKVKENGQWKYRRKEEHTIRAFYLPFEDAYKYAAKVLEIRKTREEYDPSDIPF